MKSKYILCFVVFVLLSACNETSNNDVKQNIKSIQYEFKEPTNFPFEVNDVSTSIDIGPVDYLHQFIFYYRNKESTQQIKYILSKILNEPKENDFSREDKTEYKLKNGISAYYEENERNQSIWWKNDDGTVGRFVYYINGNSRDLGEYKLEAEELVELANQVQ
ncbi:hypothetical protein [Alkalihalobacillus sp. AL-G]|uniref:hypothetical protein n=1 Tax=Alkalihalobacillus sp. AL-G TaxID=2926399 RepID=UPI00272C3B52|nr:hypothetical protein [Alkalihalobacillus sp. AL-G]WLD94489.1 hypothetical protein MOJ78_06270 [Alkalihalobacillus sp. AL-G]